MGRVSTVADNGPAGRLAAVDEAFASLPERFLGADPGFDATYQIRLCDIGRTWEVRCTRHGARVRKGGTRRRPDAVSDCRNVVLTQSMRRTAAPAAQLTATALRRPT